MKAKATAFAYNCEMSLYSHLGWTALKKRLMLVYKNEHVYLRIRIDAQIVCFCSRMKGILTRVPGTPLGTNI